jgi:HD-like signal output (HDOD) protein/CheY-like chemotaxis protein
MKRILFVDDEQHVLDGLQDLLRKHRREWDMVFVLAADAALRELAGGTFDVVITDMRMPGQDGAAFLQVVKDKYPSVARIVLSGQAQRESIMRAMPVAHQYLSKPCDADHLRAVIDRVCNLQSLLHDDNIRRLAGKVQRLPSLPRCYTQLTQALSQPNVGLAQLVDIVETDPAMSTKVLQLVNSAYFGLPRRTSSILEAVRYLGVELLKGLALTSHVFAALEAKPIRGFSFDQLQQHSLLTARLARRLMPEPSRAEEAFTAGVVHEIGQIVLALWFPEAMPAVTDAVKESGRARHEIEKATFGVTHSQVGAYLLGVWGLPFSIIEATACLHSPGLVTTGSRELLAAVHVADALVSQVCAANSGQLATDGIDLEFLEAAGLGHLLPSWRAIAADELLPKVKVA